MNGKNILKHHLQVKKLQSAFDKVAHAFNIMGDGPLFMQDFQL